jgi:hypothetical protein
MAKEPLYMWFTGDDFKYQLRHPDIEVIDSGRVFLRFNPRQYSDTGYPSAVANLCRCTDEELLEAGFVRISTCTPKMGMGCWADHGFFPVHSAHAWLARFLLRSEEDRSKIRVSVVGMRYPDWFMEKHHDCA